MNAAHLFVPSLLVVCGLVALAFATGRRGRRVAHLAVVAAAIVGVGMVPLLATLLGTLLRFPALPASLFSVLGVCVVALLVPMAVSGAGILGARRTRPVHARVARWIVPTVFAAALVGVVMALAATPIPFAVTPRDAATSPAKP